MRIFRSIYFYISSFYVFFALSAELCRAQDILLVDKSYIYSMPMTSAKFIYHLLEKNGVFIVDGSKSNLPICLDKQSSILYGMWNSEHNVMLLCTQNGDNKQIARTFAHEAVHLVQDCRAGFHNKYLQEAHKGTERFLDYLKGATPFNFHAMTTLYGKDQILLEAEARYFSDSIHKTSSVVTLLEAYCGFKF